MTGKGQWSEPTLPPVVTLRALIITHFYKRTVVTIFTQLIKKYVQTVFPLVIVAHIVHQIVVPKTC